MKLEEGQFVEIPTFGADGNPTGQPIYIGRTGSMLQLRIGSASLWIKDITTLRQVVSGFSEGSKDVQTGPCGQCHGCLSWGPCWR